MSGAIRHVKVSARPDGTDSGQIQPSDWNNSLRMTGGSNGGVLVRDTSDATYGTRLSSTFLSPYRVEDYGAVGDGSTDDSTAIEAAIAAMDQSLGGVLWFNSGQVYKTTRITTIGKSNVLVKGNFSEILFQPVLPLTYDRAFLVHGNDFSAARAVTGAIAIGAASFVGASAGDLVAGDWVFVYELGASAGGGDMVYIDWMQVSSVSGGSTINVIGKFRTAFPGTHGAIYYHRVNTLVQNVDVENLRVRTTDATNALPSFFSGVARNVRFRNCVANAKKGNGFASYRTCGLVLDNCTQLRGQGQASEIAGTVNLAINGGAFGCVDDPPDTSSLVLDFGTGFFSVNDVAFYNAGNIAVQMISVRDGNLSHCNFGWVRNAGIAGNGIAGYGCERVHVTENNLAGGDGAGYGISMQDTTLWPTLNAVSQYNVVAFNTPKNFGTPYFVQNPLDLLVDHRLSTVLTSLMGLYASSIVDPLVNGPAKFHEGTDQNAWIRTDGVATAQLAFINDAFSAYVNGRIDAATLTINGASGGILANGGAFTRINPVTAPSTSLTGTVSDLAIPGVSTANIVRIGSGLPGAFSLTGLAAPVTGTEFTLLNISAYTITLKHDVTSAASNRFLCPGSTDYALLQNAAVDLWFDAATSRWRVR